jgi:alpha-tubulin suppressor-like RCC1 family protein
MAVKSDGTVWGTGYNKYGQLGDGSETTRYSPVQVVSLSGAEQVSTGYEHSLALATDDTVYSWGTNELGQIGR